MARIVHFERSEWGIIQYQPHRGREITMAKETYYYDRGEMSTDAHKPARPLKFFKDKDGYGWLCDKDIDPERDLRKQGCWRCDEMAFPTGGR
jgi:hypothetical protein